MFKSITEESNTTCNTRQVICLVRGKCSLKDGLRDERNGFLFVLEGIDGSGKSTACLRLLDILKNDGYDVVYLREPTNESPWGKEMRERSPRG